MSKIIIENCNNIKHADISLNEGEINIKYGHNGTGKTTISQAIRYSFEENKLNELIPYGSEDKPSVSKISFKKVMVFNEEYVKNYLFKETGIFDNSYKVLLRSRECEELMENIDKMLHDLQHTFINDDSIDKLKDLLEEYISVVNYTDGSITKRGGVNEFIKGNGTGFDKHKELHVYRPFYQQKEFKRIADWASWRTKGISQMVNDKICPFCAIEMDRNIINKQNIIIEKVFKASAIKTASAILKYLDNGVKKGYVSKGAKNRIEKIIGDSEKSDEIEAELNSLANETNYLQKKLYSILNFKPMNISHEQLNDLRGSINKMNIDMSQVPRFYTTDVMEKLATDIKRKIDVLLKNIGELNGLFHKHEKKLSTLIDKRKSDINRFFLLAGFPYEFKINKIGEKQATTYLTPISIEEFTISKPESHLSWGERNAFSLVMFMFEAVSEDADLIVLDDPISAFDCTKKYAVMRRMFDAKEDVSFYNKTILILTHDLQPIIDYVHGSFAKQYNVKVDAKYIQNEKGIIHEKIITKDDLCNVVNQTKELAMDDSIPLHVRVVNCRKNIELIESDYENNMGYQILSNIVHSRDIPYKKINDKRFIMEEREVIDALKILKEYNIKLTYDEIIANLSTKNLIDIIDCDNSYYKTLAIRLILERCDGMLGKLRKKCPGASKFLNETNHIENDYVFQLNPAKFFIIPDVYYSDIEAFINEHKNEILGTIN